MNRHVVHNSADQLMDENNGSQVILNSIPMALAMVQDKVFLLAHTKAFEAPLLFPQSCVWWHSLVLINIYECPIGHVVPNPVDQLMDYNKRQTGSRLKPLLGNQT